MGAVQFVKQTRSNSVCCIELVAVAEVRLVNEFYRLQAGVRRAGTSRCVQVGEWVKVRDGLLSGRELRRDLCGTGWRR